MKHLNKNRSADEPGEARLTLVELAQRPYPPLARQTRITGDVEPALDGAVRYVTGMKGHPLLTRAAGDSAQNSRFDCKMCGGARTRTKSPIPFSCPIRRGA